MQPTVMLVGLMWPGQAKHPKGCATPAVVGKLDMSSMPEFRVLISFQHRQTFRAFGLHIMYGQALKHNMSQHGRSGSRQMPCRGHARKPSVGSMLSPQEAYNLQSWTYQNCGIPDALIRLPKV